MTHLEHEPARAVEGMRTSDHALRVAVTYLTLAAPSTQAASASELPSTSSTP